MLLSLRIKLAAAALAVLTAGFAAAQGQAGHDHGSPNSEKPAAPSEKPAAPSEKPVALLAGLGNWRHPIATRNPEAQKYFDQGLAMVYGFNRDEALRSFRKVAELDPKAPMAYWGMAMALGPYVNMDGDPSYRMKDSCDAVNAGLQIEAINATERGWLEAAGARCPDFSDPSRYVAAMRALAARLPDDPDAQTFYAEALMVPVRWKWYVDGKPAAGVEEAERVLQGVLRRYPQHPGANHYYIHAVESSPTPERGVPSAQRLMGIVPGAGHVVHMPAHIWLALGDFNNAASVNERAVEVDRKYFALTGVSGSYSMYYMHNLQFLIYARAMQGRVVETGKAAMELAAAVAPMRGMPEMADMVDVVTSFITMSRLRLQRWDEVLAEGQPKGALGAAFRRHARALALIAKGDREGARHEQEEFAKTAKGLDRNTQWGNNKLGDVVDLAAAALAARMESEPRQAAPLWKRAVELQDALVYDEPPAWYYPLRESWGAALLNSGDAEGAEAVFREGLRRSPNNGRMLFGLLESLKAQKKSDAAMWVEREFQAAWKGAEVKLSLRDL